MPSQTSERKRYRLRLPRLSLWKSARTSTTSTTSIEESFNHSQPLEDIHTKPTKSFTTLPCRVPLQEKAVRAAINRIYDDEDIKQIASTDILDMSYTASDSAIGRYSALLYPDCIPQRVDTVTFIIEAAVFYDDVMDDDSCAGIKDDMTKAVLFTAGNSARKRAIQKWIAKNSLELVTLYGKEGRVLLQSCQDGWTDMCKTNTEKRATTYEGYILQRVRNIALPSLWITTAFSLGILLTSEESKFIQPLTDMANRIFIQTNDYFSWGVERKQTNVQNFNAVPCLMEENDISEEQAEARLKSYIIRDEMMYQSMLDSFHETNPTLPTHIRKYIVAMSLFLGGNHNWSAICPRYTPSEALGRKHAPVASNIEANVIISAPNDPGSDQSAMISDIDKSSTAWARKESALDTTAVLAAPRYIQSLPSKNFRSQLVDAFNIWFELPEDRVSIIKGVIDDLHNASLILDDIQDESILRRGRAAAHCVFGSAQCINSATYMVLQAATRIYDQHTKTPHSMDHAMGVLLDGLSGLSIGQSWDLNWKFKSYCPSGIEYMKMIDGKTGAMFKMLVRLMQCMSSLETRHMTDFDRFTRLLGRWYQVRDDYQNLQDREYTEQKGFCEDLDEGKLSYPVVICCNSDPAAGEIILGIFQRNDNGKSLTRSVKMQILDLLRKSGALKETWKMVQQLEKETVDALSALETVLGETNPSLRLVTKLLGDIPPPE